MTFLSGNLDITYFDNIQGLRTNETQRCVQKINLKVSTSVENDVDLVASYDAHVDSAEAHGLRTLKLNSIQCFNFKL